MEITKREILFSVIIISIMVLIGTIISRPILTHSMNNALKITSSVQAKDSLAFDYIIRTNAGDFLAEGTIHAINRVSIEDIDGEYSRIIRKTQEYQEHTETYTTTDSEGNIQTHTRTYWSWNTIHTDKYISDSLSFHGDTLTYKNIRHEPVMSYLKTITPKRNLFQKKIRYLYYTAPATEQGVLSGNISDKSFSELRFSPNTDIDTMIEHSEKQKHNAPITFWILWIILTVGLTIGFYVFENKWLY